MGDPDAPRKPGGGLWLPILGTGVAVYLALWGVTLVFGLRAVRELADVIPSNAAYPAELVGTFDPADYPPRVPEDPTKSYYFAGNAFCPCPFVVSFDLAGMSKESGSACRMYAVWFLDLKKPFRIKPYWEYGK
jgi:hypothetical protein